MRVLFALALPCVLCTCGVEDQDVTDLLR